MQFRSKLLQRRAAAAGVTLNKIYNVCLNPDGRVEGEGETIAETLERGNEVLLRRSNAPRGCPSLPQTVDVAGRKLPQFVSSKISTLRTLPLAWFWQG
jgi:urease gamma subunit